MLITNILVPVDGSKYSINAFNTALDIAEKYDAKIIVLICLEKENISVWCVDKKSHSQIIKNAKNFAMEILSKLEKSGKEAGVSVSTHIIETKSVSKQINEFAISNKIDLIIMGSHGRTGYNKLILGSVSNSVCHSSKCPVLIIK